MKKISALFFPLLLALPVLAACGPTADDPEEIVIRFVPSNQATADPAMLLKIQGIEAMLEEKIEGHTFDLAVVADYDTLTAAMISGQVHVGFLTSQQYAYVTEEEPGKVEVLLSSVRNAYAAQIDDEGNEITDKETIIANVNAEGYSGQYHESVKVTSYYSMLLVKRDSTINSVADLEGKKVATGAQTSGSGYVYPAVLLNQSGLSFTVDEPGDNEVQAIEISGGHQTQIKAMLDNDVDAAFAFLDARTGTTAFDAYNAVEGQNIFADTRVVDLSNGIYNDTISAVTSLSDELKEEIETAFLEIIETEFGLAALSIYNHTGYIRADDADYEGEREVYRFKRDNL
jgi:phosphonate transport system substrate-binding protein